MAIDGVTARSRRALLLGAAGGLAALAAQAVGRPIGATAGQDPVLLNVENSGFLNPTKIRTTQASGAFEGISQYGPALRGHSQDGDGVAGYGYGLTGRGVVGHGSLKEGVYGDSEASSGVYGKSTSGFGVRAKSKTNTGVHGASESGYGIQGDSPSNYGVYGTSGSSYAVVGLSGSSIGVAGFGDSGEGVYGMSASANGVHGFTSGTAAGVLGESALGRGGRFKGKKAQIRLEPSTAATHPDSGAAGDIFVDASKRVWFCKGGDTWVRLDT